MSVVVGGEGLPAPVGWAGGHTVALVGLDRGQLERALGAGFDRVVLVRSAGAPSGAIDQLGFELLRSSRARVVMVVHIVRLATGADLARWCASTEQFGTWDAGFRLPLAAGAVAPAHIRRAVADYVGTTTPGAVVTSAALAASELVSNALQHVGDGRFELQVTDDEIGVAVFDAKPDRWPTPEAPAPLADAGRGLGIVAAVADAWGIAAGPDEKAMWCELRRRDTDEPTGMEAIASFEPTGGTSYLSRPG